ncbi:MAG: DNA polymerase III subunit alpha [Clostridia bacterium]|nr:DNA polymerase III subunit alpha [Clostridia bacterium]
MPFTHLHLHTEYSLLDGACRIGPLLDKIKSMGQTSCAISDHGVMYGALDFFTQAESRGIKAIIGCEVYVAPRKYTDKVHGIDNERYHLILLCKNETGYKNLIKLVSESWVNGFYIKPRIDRELLSRYNEGLICLSGCYFGEVSQAILNDGYDKAKGIALWYKSVFGDDYYLEIQNHGLKEQLRINNDLIKLSDETGISLAATNDAHYINKEDSIVQQALICLGTNHIIGEETGLDFQTEEFYVKSEEEMLEAFSFCPQAVENTNVIAEKCNFRFEFGNTKLPHFEIPDGSDHIDWFNNMCRRGFRQKYGDNPPKEYVDRLNYELDVINSMGYTDYYLIVHDFINYAKSKGIPVGPGRGSGAASICAYCIGITGIDPMKYNLLFERFLNPERVSMPDFDIDFCYERRQEVIDYVIEKYGADHVAQIVTFGTLAARQAVRDIGRVKGSAYGNVDRIAKLIPNELNITIDSALRESDELRELYESDKEVKDIVDLASKVESMPRHASTHAAGIVITADPVDTYVPLAKNDDNTVTQFTMKGLEKLGLLKMDFLGLRTLTVINDAIKSIRNTNPGFDISKVNLNDKETYEMFSQGKTEGVFQFESDGMKRVLTRIKPESLEDLIAVIALYRPGPMKYIDTYVANRRNKSSIKYDIPELKNILDVTYGCMVYQEQVMQICREVAGYSYGRADIVRRAMSKKQHDVMLKERSAFVEGAKGRGVSEKAADKLFDEMVSFASYAFNKAHAAAYAYVSYQTAYLKCHYPKEYFAALLTSFIDRPEKISEYISACNSLGIKILPPHVNLSENAFTASDEGIVFCLSAVKNVGRGFISKMIAERNMNGRFSSLYDFCSRLIGNEFNRRACESLIKCGAFDNLGANRRQMLQSIEQIINLIETDRNGNIAGQIGFGDLDADTGDYEDFEFAEAEDYSQSELLRMEKDVTGIYISGNPLEKNSAVSEKIGCDRISDILNDKLKYHDNKNITLLAQINEVKKKSTKNGSVMAFLQIEDITAPCESIVFAKVYEDFRSYLISGNTVLLHGRVSHNDDSTVSIIAVSFEKIPEIDSIPDKETQSKEPKQENVKNKSVKKGLFLRFDTSESPQIKICKNLLSIFEGTEPAYFYYADSKKYINAGKCDCNEVMLRELKKILGSDNVIFNQ